MKQCESCQGTKKKCIGKDGKDFLMVSCRYFNVGDCPDECYLEKHLCPACNGIGEVAK